MPFVHFPDRERLLSLIQERSLAGRNITPDDVADVVCLLSSPEAFMKAAVELV